ncbi:hypothetical protein LOTGIDRAFT_233544 [Lottia gigantea]|uniref:Death domain-containing protein n=1 Tax=Lottia gigantea TaxID=225164 RepID=V4A2Y9_LOTGI|nr:hypothetical protein LOTGIDRAFT_233544 [Lottia gigantea]ESO91067.1 hypothetical protein LOTGIDRAFT_233544 [Lottia gigantea]
MEEDSVPQKPAPEATGHSKNTSRPNIKLITPDGSRFEISSECGNLGTNVMIGACNVMNVEHFSETRKRRKAKQPLSENKEEPGRHLLQKIASKIIMEEAIMLGRVLNLSDAKIDEIKVDNSTSGAAEIKYQILAEWCKKDENPTIATLAFALNNIERGDISDRLPR